MPNDEGNGTVRGGCSVNRKIVNYGQSVRERLLAVAKQKDVQFEYILLRYAFDS